MVIVGELYALVYRTTGLDPAPVDVTGSIAFGVVLGPHVAFGGGAAAVARIPVTHHVSLPASTVVVASVESGGPVTPGAVAAAVPLGEAVVLGSVFGVVGAAVAAIAREYLSVRRRVTGPMTDKRSTDRVDTLVRGRLVRPHTGDVREGAVAIEDGEIRALEERPADRTLEAGYVVPGLIDAHVHVESSMTTVAGYGRAVVPRGVTGIVWDPHEIANVAGEQGVRDALADAAAAPLKAYVAVPSSVPASELQDAGATLGPDGVERLMDDHPERVVALAEVMDLDGVLSGDADVMAKIAAARDRGLTVDGHLPGVTGAALQAAARHLDTDHESTTLAEATETLEAGIYTYLRSGSTTPPIRDLLPIVADGDHETRYLSFCTDDRDVVDLLDEGGVNDPVRAAIAAGVDPVEAVQMATINTADRYGLATGRLTPGAPADLVLLDDLESWCVEHVLVDGVLDPVSSADDPPPESNVARDTVAFAPLAAADLATTVDAAPGTTVRVRAIDCTGPRTRELLATVAVGEDGRLRADGDADVLPLAVVERHGKDAGVGTGFVHGLGLARGAIGSTVGHDAHNLTLAGVDHAAMLRVARRLKDVGGGIAAYDPESDTLETLPLPVAGLVSDAPLAEISRQFRAVESLATGLGLDLDSGLMTLSSLPLEVIPELRMTNNGLVDVTRMAYTDVVLGD